VRLGYGLEAEAQQEVCKEDQLLCSFILKDKETLLIILRRKIITYIEEIQKQNAERPVKRLEIIQTSNDGDLK
jgi:hypothetical protein